MRLSRRAGGSDWIVVVIGGLSDSTTFLGALAGTQYENDERNYLGDLRIRGQESPINVCTISNIWVVVFRSRCLQDFLY